MAVWLCIGATVALGGLWWFLEDMRLLYHVLFGTLMASSLMLALLLIRGERLECEVQPCPFGSSRLFVSNRFAGSSCFCIIDGTGAHKTGYAFEASQR